MSTVGTKYITFSLGQEEYAIPLLTVKEVIAVPEVTQVPNSPSYFLGIMNLRGQVISIVDLRAKLGIKSANTTETAVIICDFKVMSLGIVVDSIISVISPNENELSDRPDLPMTKASEYVTGVYRHDNRLTLLLDLERTLDIQTYVKLVGNTNTAKAA